MSSGNIGFYLRRFRGRRPCLLLIFLLYAVKHGVWILFPLIVRRIIDIYIPNRDPRGVLMCIPVVIGLAIVNVACHSPYRMLLAGMVKSISRDLRYKIISKLQILSLSFMRRSETGRAYSKIMVDVNKIEQLTFTLAGHGLGALFSFFYSAVFLALINLKIFALFMLVVPSYVVIYRFFAKRFAKYQHEARMADENLSASVSSFIQTNLLSRMHGVEDYERDRVHEKGAEIVRSYKVINRNLGLFSHIMVGVSQTFQIGIISVCAFAVMRGEMTIGTLVVFHTYMNLVASAILHFMDLFPHVIEARESIVSVRELLDSPDIERNENKPRVAAVKGDIRFQNVSFAYPGGPNVVEDLDLDLPAGSTLALVGPSGSGKSTFVNLLLGLIRPQTGAVYIDGRDINEIDMRSVRTSVGVVTQEPILFRGTIAENIAHANPEASMAAIVEAAKRAHAHDFIVACNDGYESSVGEGGITLSGGQRQRLTIARAILRHPSILVFDEATSAIDSISEAAVQKGIEALLGRQTTITIAHRLSTVRKADVLLVLEQGRVVESGSPDELLRRGGAYATMFRAQAEPFLAGTRAGQGRAWQGRSC